MTKTKKKNDALYGMCQKRKAICKNFGFSKSDTLFFLVMYKLDGFNKIKIFFAHTGICVSEFRFSCNMVHGNSGYYGWWISSYVSTNQTELYILIKRKWRSTFNCAYTVDFHFFFGTLFLEYE